MSPLRSRWLVVSAGIDQHDILVIEHADLSFADFSGSDLSGFDFTGANLHGVTGVDVKWDIATR
jgi:hypothetical protein